MTHPKNISPEQKYKKWIVAVSIVVPVVVAALFGLPKIEGVNTRFLPPIYATINAITALLLIAALIAIKKKNIQLHQQLVQTAIACSLLFLACYIAYHLTSPQVKYGDFNGNGEVDPSELLLVSDSRLPYLILLAAHILLSVVVIPIVLFTYVRGISGDTVRHRKIARIAFPIWLFVAVSGVAVYVMIAPFAEKRHNVVNDKRVVLQAPTNDVETKVPAHLTTGYRRFSAAR